MNNADITVQRLHLGEVISPTGTTACTEAHYTVAEWANIPGAALSQPTTLAPARGEVRSNASHNGPTPSVANQRRSTTQP